jgi:hypothetical protein
VLNNAKKLVEIIKSVILAGFKFLLVYILSYSKQRMMKMLQSVRYLFSSNEKRRKSEILENLVGKTVVMNLATFGCVLKKCINFY